MVVNRTSQHPRWCMYLGLHMNHPYRVIYLHELLANEVEPFINMLRPDGAGAAIRELHRLIIAVDLSIVMGRLKLIRTRLNKPTHLRSSFEKMKFPESLHRCSVTASQSHSSVVFRVTKVLGATGQAHNRPPSRAPPMQLYRTPT